MIRVIFVSLLMLSFSFVYAQIGVDSSDPHASSILDLNSTDKGLLIPRMTSAQRMSILSPANSLLVFDLTLNEYLYYFDGEWRSFTSWNKTATGSSIYYSAGNVGVGTASPNAPLQFSNSNANRKIVFHEAGNNDHQFYGFGLDPTGLRFQVSGTTGTTFKWYAGTSPTASDELLTLTGYGILKFPNTGTTNRKLVLYESGDNNYQYYGFGLGADALHYKVGTTAGQHVWFAGTSSTAEQELMRLTADGTLRGKYLEFSDYLDVGLNGYKAAINGQSNGYLVLRDADLTSQVYITSNGASYLNGGSLGVGTTPPATHSNFAFQFLGSAMTLMAAKNGSENYVGSNIYYDGTWKKRIADESSLIGQSGGVISFYTNAAGGAGSSVTWGSPKMVMDVNGNLDLNAGELDVLNGNVISGRDVLWNGSNSGNARSLKIGYSGGNYGGIGYGINFTASSDIWQYAVADRVSLLDFRNGGFRFLGTSAVGVVGNAVSFSTLMDVTNTGSISIAGTGSATDWVATSDRRLKRNIVPAGSQLEKVQSISAIVRTYDRTDTDKNETGFVAQELLDVAPEYVSVPDDSTQMMSVNYLKMVVPLYKAVSELNARIDALEKENEELKALLKK